MRHIMAAVLLLGLGAAFLAATPGPAEAQATCRQKCMDEENACLARTGNKSQCGGRAQSCHAKCR
jgi:hypothetical protein